VANDPDARPAEALYLRLEVTPGASRREIVSAYRRLVHGAHPDALPDDPGAAQRFREITEAYDVLSDPLRRASYDRSRAGARLEVARPTEVGESPSDRPGDHRIRPEPDSQGIDLPPMRPTAVPLWAGPVHVEPGSWSMPTTPSHPLTDPVAEIASLLSDFLESWWMY
jgi:curved DNA-binding protein CbpA